MHGPCLGSVCRQPSKCINTFDNKISVIRMNHLLSRVHFFLLTLYCLRYLVCLNVKSSRGKVYFYLFVLVFWPSFYFIVKKRLFKYLPSMVFLTMIVKKKHDVQLRASRRKKKVNQLSSYFLTSCPNKTNVR